MHAAGTAERQPEPQSPAANAAEAGMGALDTKFNLEHFSPPAPRRLSSGLAATLLKSLLMICVYCHPCMQALHLGAFAMNISMLECLV